MHVLQDEFETVGNIVAQLLPDLNDELDNGKCALVDAAMKGPVTLEVLTSYIDIALGSQYGPESGRMFGTIHAGVYLHNDVGEIPGATHSCPPSVRNDVRQKFEKHKALFWVITSPGEKMGHWFLAVIYPTFRKVALIDSCFDQKIHKSVARVCFRHSTNSHCPVSSDELFII